VFHQREVALGEATGEEREAFAEEDGDDAEVEFVDEIFLEESAGEFAAAHVPNVFAGLLAERFEKGFGGVVDEGDAEAFAGRLGLRHDVIFHGAAETAAHFLGDVEGFAAHESGVDGGEKGGHRIVFGHEEEVDGAVEAGDVTVERDAEAEDDLAHKGDCK